MDNNNIDKLNQIFDSLNTGPDLDSKSGIERELKRLSKVLDDAKDKGYSQEYIDALSEQVGALKTMSKNLEDFEKSTIDRLQDIAGNRTLDINEIKLFAEFKKVYIEEKTRIEKLEEAKRNATRQGDIDRITEAIQHAEDKISQARENLGNDTDAREAADKWETDTDGYQKERSLLEQNNDLRDQSKEKTEAITKAQAANNAALEKGAVYWQMIKESAQFVWGQLKDGGNLWLKYNAQAIADAKKLGFTQKEEARAYTQALMENSKQLARNFGMSVDQAMKMQEVYGKVTGRASLLTYEQMSDIAAAGRLMGEESINSAMQVMDTMGSTSQTAMELMDKNYARAVNSGLDAAKASEAFANNMSLANKMTFKGGVDGISKMTILSQKLKFNLQEVANVADKFSTIEGAIEGSAQLQMLGGTGAMFGGNPMQMMYEALNDGEAFTERLTKMWSSQATFDAKTGEAKLSAIQLQIIKEQAKAIGANPDDAVNIAKNLARNRDLENKWRAANSTTFNNATEEEKSFIENKAQYNKETRQWEISYFNKNGEKVEGKAVNELTPEDMKDIMSNNIEPVEDIRGKVRQIASTLVSTQDRIQSLKDQWKTGLAQMVNGFMEWGDDRLTDANDSSTATGKLVDFFTSGKWTQQGLGLLAGAGATALKVYAGWKFTKFLKNKAFGWLGGSRGAASATGTAANTARAAGAAANATSAAGAAGTTASAAGTGAGAASSAGAATRAGSRFGSVASKWGGVARMGGKALRWGSKAAKVAGPLAVLADVGFAAYDYYQAGEERKATEQYIQAQEQQVNTLTGRARYGQHDIAEKRKLADNKESEAKGEAIGAGGGALAGAAAGAAVGSVIPVIGTAVGAAVGGIIGGIVGAFAGRKSAKTEEVDTISKHLEEINDGDEEDNIKKIVLPVESIDYNVALIANQLGIISAMPARGNVYLDAELAGDIEAPQAVQMGSPVAMSAEGEPLQASQVTPVYNQVSYGGSVNGNIHLDIDGAINLKLDGSATNVKFTAQDLKKLIENDPSFQKQLADIITNQQVRNGNAGRNNYENADARRGTTSGTYIGNNY